MLVYLLGAPILAVAYSIRTRYVILDELREMEERITKKLSE